MVKIYTSIKVIYEYFKYLKINIYIYILTNDTHRVNCTFFYKDFYININTQQKTPKKAPTPRYLLHGRT